MTVASEQISKVTTSVTDKLANVMRWAQDAQTTAEATINSVGHIPTPSIVLNTPAAPSIDAPTDPGLNDVPDPDVDNSPKSVSFTSSSQVAMKAPPDIPDAVYGVPVKPDARPSKQLPLPDVDYPVAAFSTKPDKPDITPPDKPDFMGVIDRPKLEAIKLPDYPTLTIDMYDEVPEYDDPMPPESYMKYEKADSDLVEFAIQQLSNADNGYSILTFIAGNSDLLKNQMKPVAIAVERLRGDLVGTVDKETQKAVDDIFIKWAGQNFSIPNGMILSEINEAQLAGGKKIREGSLAIGKRLTEEAIERYELYFKTGMLLQKYLHDVFIEELRQLIKIYQVELDGEFSLFETTLKYFTTQQKAVSARFDAYKSYIETKLKWLLTQTAKVDGAVAEIAENKVYTQIYKGDVQLQKATAITYTNEVDALLTEVDVYKHELEGAKADSEIVAANFQSWSTALKGYAAAVKASFAEIDAYTAEVQATSSETSVYQANAQAYSTYVEESVKKNKAYQVFASLQSDVLNANIAAFKDAAAANEGFVRAQSQKIAAKSELISARLSAFNNSIKAYSEYNRATAIYNYSLDSYALMTAESNARTKAINELIQAEMDKIDVGSLAAKAQALAALAQGAMSAMHVSASSQGSASTADSISFDEGATANWGGHVAKSETKRQVLSA